MDSAPRRIPAGHELTSLMRWYGYRTTRTGGVAGCEPVRSQAETDALVAAGWPVGQREQWSREEVVERASSAARSLEPGAVRAGWVAGLGSAPRGRQTAISFGWARYLPLAPRQEDGAPDCGVPVQAQVDVTEQLLRLALGWSWNEVPEHFLPDLEAAAGEGLPVPTDDDRARLRALLDLVVAQPSGTTPGALEKAVAREKIVPGTDKYQRYGILIGLAEMGVLPSSTLAPSWDRFVSRAQLHAAATSGGPRSDITQPLAGWRGGIDARRAQELVAV